MDEEEKNENKKDESLLGKLKKGVKKNNKSKFKMIMSKIIAAIGIKTFVIFLIIMAVAATLGALITIFDFEGDNNIASEAINSALKNKELVNIAKAPEDQGYYFKIDKKIKDEYVKLLNKAYYEGYYHENAPEKDEDKPEFEYNSDRANIKEEDIVEWFLTEDYEPYLIKMIRAEIASSYPKLGDYEGEDDPKSEKNRELGNKIDPDGNYVAQGRTKIQRTKMGLDGTPAAEAIDLEYVPYEEFQEMLKRTDESAMEVLNYFSFKEETGLIYYATYKIVTVEVNGVEVSRTFQLEENSVSYKTVTNMCNMPYNFLFAILQSSENPEWTMAVIDLLLKDENHELILMIQDQLNIVKDTVVETEYHAQRTVTETFTSVGSERTGYGWVSNGLSNATYSYPAGAPIITTTVTTTYTNTAQVFVKKAKTWCIDFEQEANLVVTEEEGEAVVTDETAGYTDATYAGLGYPSTNGASGLGTPTSAGETTTVTHTSLSNGTLLYSTSEKIDTKDFSWDISTVTEKRINYERFLGLWKNTKGEYEIGCLFDPNGKKVGYTLPKQDDTLVYPPDTMSMENHQDIDYLIEALSLHEDTQMHEQLMMYYWNMYTGENWYDVDLDGLLDYFDTEVFIHVGSLYGSNVEEKLWYALIDAGFSEYAAAGAMGNIWAESGMRTNNLENSKESILGMNDDQYTEAVDNGTYQNFASDRAGYGLCQWTSEGRKQGLQNYISNKGVSISDANSQIEYLLAELGVSNSASGNATYQLLTYNGYGADDWKNAENESEAATAFCWSFERPGKSSANLSGRISKAIEYYKRFHGQKRPVFNGETVQGGSYTFPHYLQKDYSSSYGTSTISRSGCGPTSLAMVLSGLLGDSSIDPISVAENIKDNWPDGSYYVAGAGSSHCIFDSSFLKKYYGVTSTYIKNKTNSEALALKALEQGYPVIRRRTRAYTCYSSSIRRTKSTGL